jgi:hypothetical protein
MRSRHLSLASTALLTTVRGSRPCWTSSTAFTSAAPLPAKHYRAQGVAMLAERAQFPDGTNAVEAGVLSILDRMRTGRLKVFSHLTEWFEEFRVYHRKDGRIHKANDHLLVATGMDYDLFGQA